MNASRSCSSPSTGPQANLPSTTTTITKIASVQIALPRLPANGLSASASSAAWIGSAVSARKATINSFFIASRFNVVNRGRRAPRPPPASFLLRLQDRHHADDDGEQGRAFDHGRGDDHRG